MKAWLFAGGSARESAFPYHIVFIREEAAQMTEHDAHEVMRGAEAGYPEYSWGTVAIPGKLFIVEGTKE